MHYKSTHLPNTSKTTNYLGEDLKVHDSGFEFLAGLRIKIKSLQCNSAWFGTHALAAAIFKIEKIAFMLS
jgi:hypothetical protein